MSTSTTNYAFTKPAVNSAVDQDLWGDELNTNFDTLDTLLGARTANKYGAVIVQNSSDTGFDTITSQGTAGWVLTSNGADALPSFQASSGSVTMSDVYPIGSIYSNVTNSTNPATLLGFGTWTAITDKFIIGASGTYAAGTTGGSATHTNTLAEMVAHTHDITLYGTVSNSSSTTMAGTAAIGTHATTSSVGSSTAYSILNPYLAAYCWYRTA